MTIKSVVVEPIEVVRNRRKEKWLEIATAELIKSGAYQPEEYNDALDMAENIWDNTDNEGEQWANWVDAVDAVKEELSYWGD